MHDDTTKLTERGQTSVPAFLRKKYNLKTGQKLVWQAVSEDEIRIKVRNQKKISNINLGIGYLNKYFNIPNDLTSDKAMSILREGEKTK